MRQPWVRFLAVLFFPAGMLILLIAALVAAGALPGAIPEAFLQYRWLVWAGAALLGWRFHRARVVFAVLALALADQFLSAFAPGAQALSGRGQLVFDAVALLLPLDLAFLACMKERGLISRWGASVAGALLAQISAVFVLGLVPDSRLAVALTHRFAGSGPLGDLTLSTPSLVTFLLGGVAVSLAFMVRRSAVEAGFIWVAGAVLLALAPGKPGTLSTLYLCAAALALGASVIETGHAMAFRDDLTGLPGRRALNEALGRVEGRFALAVVDVDHFKAFNDRYGHDVGDQVLRLVAARLAGVGGGGEAFRYGGEEFAILFPSKTAREAAPVLEGIRKAIAAAGLALRGADRPKSKPSKVKPATAPRTVSVTVSMGLADGAPGADPHEVLKAADKAMYRAKKAGRNRVCT